MNTVPMEPGLQDRLHDMLVHTREGALDLLLALGVLIVGWMLAVVLSLIVRTILRAARFDSGVRRVFGERATGDHEPAGVVAWAVYWLVIAWAGLLALETLGFDLRASLTDRMLEIVPRIIAAGALLVVGGVIAVGLGRIARRFFETGGIGAARLKGQAVTVVLFAFTALLALDQLGFAAQFVMATGLIAFAGVALAVGLSFGLGCRDLVREFVVEYLRSLEDKSGAGAP